ncbi:hypothetical protein FQR65_LT10132 [Abscondita terminalis]|nr:hypothetical protein FQR65_LT10132 [Abscondita terminalis]
MYLEHRRQTHQLLTIQIVMEPKNLSIKKPLEIGSTSCISEQISVPGLTLTSAPVSTLAAGSGILSELNVTRETFISKTQENVSTAKVVLQESIQISEESRQGEFVQIMEHVNHTTCKFVMQQVLNQKLQPKEVVRTICEQERANQNAINSLIREASHHNEKAKVFKNHFLVNNIEVVPLYDVPHLLKGIRNNLSYRI